MFLHGLLYSFLYGKDRNSQAIVHGERFCPKGFSLPVTKIPRCRVDAYKVISALFQTRGAYLGNILFPEAFSNSRQQNDATLEVTCLYHDTFFLIWYGAIITLCDVFKVVCLVI